jgi:hypothetical protein
MYEYMNHCLLLISRYIKVGSNAIDCPINDPLERPSIRPHVCPSSIFFQFADDRRNLLDEEAASAATGHSEQRTIAC